MPQPGKRLVVVSIALVVVLSAVGIFLAWRNWKVQRDQVIDDTAIFARAAAAATDQLLRDRIRLLETVAAAPSVNEQDLPRMSNYFMLVNSREPGLNNVLWSDTGGTVRAQGLPDTGRSIIITDRDYYRPVLSSGRPYTSVASLARSNNRPIVPMAVPTFDSAGAVNGIVIGGLALDQLEASVAQFRLGKTGVLLVVDRANQLIAHTGEEIAITNVSTAPLVLQARQTGSGVESGVRGLQDDPDRIVAWERVPTGDWLVFVERSARDAFAPARRSFITALLLVFGVSAMGLAGSLLIGRRLDQLASEERRALRTSEALATENARLYEREQAALVRVEGERTRLHRMFLEAPAIIGFLQGPEHVFTFFNTRYQELLGGREVIGRTVREAIPELKEQGYFELLDHVYATGEPVFGNETPARLDRNGDGALEEQFFNWVFQPTHDTDGKVDGILIHAIEVTDQVRARRQVEALAAENLQLYNQARQALSVRDEFLASVSHDLKTPLTAIFGRVQLLQRMLARGDAIERDRLLELVQPIEGLTQRMIKQVSELVDLSRLESGRPLELECYPTDLVALVRMVAGELQRTTPLHEISVTAGQSEVMGNWDAARLERVFANLISNAIKYSPDGGKIQVTVDENILDDERWALVSVHDNGVGIPGTDLPHVFERFHRGSNVVGRIAGAGIGLVGSKAIIEQHNGQIKIESREGKGTVVVVQLPLM